jgi:hypothetical protein
MIDAAVLELTPIAGACQRQPNAADFRCGPYSPGYSWGFRALGLFS